MTQLLLDSDTGDLVRDGGSLVRVGGVDEIAQHVRVRLRLFRREVFLDLRKGMNYVGGLLAKGTPPNEINAEFRDQILGTAGVVEVDAIQVSRPDPSRPRVVNVDFDAPISVGDLRDRIQHNDSVTVSTQGDDT